MIYLMRHGLDDENYVGGWSDVSLIKEGILGVHSIASTLHNYDIKRIISSDIKRAKETTDIVLEYIDVPVTYDSRLRELDKGLLTGMRRDIACKDYPEYMGEVMIDKRYPNGESMLDLYIRIKKLLEEIDTWDESLVITHRGVINMIYFILEGRLPDTDKKQFNVTHASLHEYDLEKKKIKKLGGI